MGNAVGTWTYAGTTVTLNAGGSASRADNSKILVEWKNGNRP